MKLETIDALAGLRAALEAPEEQRLDIFRERVMAPLRPFWEPFMGFIGAATAQDEGDPALNAARTFGYYTPKLDVEQGLAALGRLEEARAWERCVAALEQAWTALRPEEHGLSIERVLFTFILGDPRVMNEQMGGYTGFGGMPGMVMIAAWPTDFNLPRLPAATAHEVHHNIRFSFEPFLPQSTTVGQYIVAEGLAEAFAAELCGDEYLGPWANALSDAEIAMVRPRFAGALETSGFDQVRAWIFGDSVAEKQGLAKQGLPDFAGYTIGYRVAREYLRRTGKSAAEATYVPWREIVDGSGYFQ